MLILYLVSAAGVAWIISVCLYYWQTFPNLQPKFLLWLRGFHKKTSFFGTRPRGEVRSFKDGFVEGRVRDIANLGFNDTIRVIVKLNSEEIGSAVASLPADKESFGFRVNVGERLQKRDFLDSEVCCYAYDEVGRPTLLTIDGGMIKQIISEFYPTVSMQPAVSVG